MELAFVDAKKDFPKWFQASSQRDLRVLRESEISFACHRALAERADGTVERSLARLMNDVSARQDNQFAHAVPKGRRIPTDGAGVVGLFGVAPVLSRVGKVDVQQTAGAMNPVLPLAPFADPASVAMIKVHTHSLSVPDLADRAVVSRGMTSVQTHRGRGLNGFAGHAQHLLHVEPIHKMILRVVVARAAGHPFSATARLGHYAPVVVGTTHGNSNSGAAFHLGTDGVQTPKVFLPFKTGTHLWRRAKTQLYQAPGLPERRVRRKIPKEATHPRHPAQIARGNIQQHPQPDLFWKRRDALPLEPRAAAK